jgi:hypothetical protein
LSTGLDTGSLGSSVLPSAERGCLLPSGSLSRSWFDGRRPGPPVPPTHVDRAGSRQDRLAPCATRSMTPGSSPWLSYWACAALRGVPARRRAFDRFAGSALRGRADGCAELVPTPLALVQLRDPVGPYRSPRRSKAFCAARQEGGRGISEGSDNGRRFLSGGDQRVGPAKASPSVSTRGHSVAADACRGQGSFLHTLKDSY